MCLPFRAAACPTPFPFSDQKQFVELALIPDLSAMIIQNDGAKYKILCIVLCGADLSPYPNSRFPPTEGVLKSPPHSIIPDQRRTGFHANTTEFLERRFNCHDLNSRRTVVW
jgi:hypothetical protein